jgi:hypothetical protein
MGLLWCADQVDQTRNELAAIEARTGLTNLPSFKYNSQIPGWLGEQGNR